MPALLSGRWLLMAALFLVDVPMRETAVYLLPCLLAVGWAKGKPTRAAVYAVPMALYWLAARLVIEHRFRANITDVGIHYVLNRAALLYPAYWPQLASVIGFLWIPLALGWRRLPLLERSLLMGALPGFLMSYVFGIWYETRVWLEWNAIAACLCFTILTEYLNTRKIREFSPDVGSSVELLS